jgi:predicted nuclease of predicted toxin-antitoxin system
MRFLADQNFPRRAVMALRAVGHDVAWIEEEAPGASDETILARAVTESRVLLTFDKDFGELAFQARLPATSGIVLVRLDLTDSPDGSAWLAALINTRDDWPGRFSVIEPGRIRSRDLPGST